MTFSIPFYIYCILIAIFTVINWGSIWKGVCGGNGIPQPNEIIKMFAVYIYALDCGLHMFEAKDIDIMFMGLNLGVLGITSFSKLQTRDH